ncbi:hypothetical protein [Cesiribacter sp. SM1]|uniref:hypothetical protein n=1 Tax=Cesiribacter sp. SM1 TaxID=2861196 RepID=UPI001CD5B3BB|nr:hypothetical protein [Cesiribacter sp. SM1]
MQEAIFVYIRQGAVKGICFIQWTLAIIKQLSISMIWNWEKNSLLNSYGESTQSKLIFNATLEEFARYFKPLGGTYLKSKKTIQFENEGILLNIGFNSSRSNMSGNWIAVELGISFYYRDFVVDNQLHTGVFLGDLTLFSKKLESKPNGTVIIRKIIGEDIERVEGHGMEAEERLGNVFNCYKLSTADFLKVATFLECEVLVWLTRVRNRDSLEGLLKNAGNGAKWSMSNSNFKRYLQLEFPDLIDVYNEKIINK